MTADFAPFWLSDLNPTCITYSVHATRVVLLCYIEATQGREKKKGKNNVDRTSFSTQIASSAYMSSWKLSKFQSIFPFCQSTSPFSFYLHFAHLQVLSLSVNLLLFWYKMTTQPIQWSYPIWSSNNGLQIWYWICTFNFWNDMYIRISTWIRKQHKNINKVPVSQNR